MRIKEIALFIILVITFAISGCMDVKTVVTVNRDGSGTLVDTMYLDKGTPALMQNMIKGMAQGMMKSMGGDPNDVHPGENEGEDSDKGITSEEEQELDIEKFIQKGKALGEGVEFVSAKKIYDRIDKVGVEVTYAFDDVRNLRLTFMPTEIPSDSLDSESLGKTSISFDFKQGKEAELVINIPQKKAEGETEEPLIEESDSTKEPDPLQVAMMKKFFGDFRVRVIVRVEGEILHTNATHLLSSSGLKNGDSVVLMDMNIGGMLQNEEGLKKLASFGPMQDINDARDRLKFIDELKIEKSDKVSILF